MGIYEVLARKGKKADTRKLTDKHRATSTAIPDPFLKLPISPMLFTLERGTFAPYCQTSVKCDECLLNITAF